METMTQEEKELLMKDLCCRLPYGVKCEVIKLRIDGEIVYIQNGKDALELTVDNIKELITNNLYEIKPYLFPLSSMTEEQRDEYIKTCDVVSRFTFCPTPESIDWLNSNHFDYRGLIKKGLAIDCTNLNIY